MLLFYLITQISDGIVEHVDKGLVEWVILRFHVLVRDHHAEYVFVEGACEITLEQLVVVDCLSDDASDEFEVPFWV